jgi:hypothetical protein
MNKKDFAIVSREVPDGTAVVVDTTTNQVLISGVLTDKTIGTTDPSLDVSTYPKSIMGELIEAFREISAAFKAFGTSLNSFGSTVKTESEGLGNRMKTSSDSIRGGVFGVLDKFKTMSTNLANGFNIKPEIPTFTVNKIETKPSFKKEKKEEDIEKGYKFY